MKVIEIDSSKANTFSRKGTSLGPFGGTSSRRNILSSTFIKLKDWILVENKG
jgi:hypothetical protein